MEQNAVFPVTIGFWASVRPVHEKWEMPLALIKSKRHEGIGLI